MKENLNVSEFNLKEIVENLNSIPSRGKLMESFDERSNRLTQEQKSELRKRISNFNKYGEVLRCETAIKELAKNLSEITELAEKYAMTEASDFFQQQIIKRDFKQAQNVAKNFNKLANECYGKLIELNALYEDLGKIYERYFEMNLSDDETLKS